MKRVGLSVVVAFSLACLGGHEVGQRPDAPEAPVLLEEQRRLQVLRMRRRGIEGRVGDDLLPPWAEYPEFVKSSMGWRMGVGESARHEWHVLMDQLGSNEARIEWLQQNPQAPQHWASVLGPMVGFELDRRDPTSLPGIVAELDALGVTGVDVAFTQWEANVQAGAWSAPWRKGSEQRPFDVLRHPMSARRFGLWARWASEHVHRQSQIAQWGSPPPGWEPVLEALRTGQPPSTRKTPGDLAAELAATGVLAPPWAWPVEPLWVLDVDELTLAGMWVRWANNTYDDLPSWQQYLAQWPPPPPAWRASMEQLMFLYNDGPDVLISCEPGPEGVEVVLGGVAGWRYVLAGRVLRSGKDQLRDTPLSSRWLQRWRRVDSRWAPESDQRCYRSFLEVLLTLPVIDEVDVAHPPLIKAN